jgi:hypothetical protein
MWCCVVVAYHNWLWVKGRGSNIVVERPGSACGRGVDSLGPGWPVSGAQFARYARTVVEFRRVRPNRSRLCATRKACRRRPPCPGRTADERPEGVAFLRLVQERGRNPSAHSDTATGLASHAKSTPRPPCPAPAARPRPPAPPAWARMCCQRTTRRRPASGRPVWPRMCWQDTGLTGIGAQQGAVRGGLAPSGATGAHPGPNGCPWPWRQWARWRQEPAARFAYARPSRNQVRISPSWDR